MNTKIDLSARILSYLRKNPDSADTLEGITDWWLRSECVELAVDEVAKVLDLLIKRGSIVKVKRKNGKIFYQLARDP